LFELIVVLVVIGILIFVGFLQIPNNIAFEDKVVLKSILYQKESNAMKYEVYGVDDSVCVYFDKNVLDKKENYFFKSEIISPFDYICFDKFGRVYKGEIDKNLSNLLHEKFSIIIKYKNQEKITIYPIGYIE